VKITIDLTDAEFSAVADANPGAAPADERAAARVRTLIAGSIAADLKAADDKRFAAAGLPNLKYFGLDDDQCAMLIADNAPKHAAKLAARAAEEAARSVDGTSA
jgi:hypothetical protein